MASYDIAFNYLMLWEDSHPISGKVTEDSGGLTKFGLSSKTYPKLDIRNLSLEEAKDIYKSDWWELEWESLDQTLANKYFQMQVNLGHKGFSELIAVIDYIYGPFQHLNIYPLLCVAQLTHYQDRYGGMEKVPNGLKRRAKG